VLTTPLLTVNPISPVGATNVPVGSVQLKVQVLNGATPVEGATVKFSVESQLVCTATSDSSGFATCTFTATQPDHLYHWYAIAAQTGFAQGHTQIIVFETA
jgi:hypothetical protein